MRAENLGQNTSTKIRKPRQKKAREEKKKFDIFGDFESSILCTTSLKMKFKDPNCDLTKFLINFDFETTPGQGLFDEMKFALRTDIGYRRKKLVTKGDPKGQNGEQDSQYVSDDEFQENEPMADLEEPPSQNLISGSTYPEFNISHG